MEEGASVAMTSASACRWPPESEPIGWPSRRSRPMPSSATRSEIVAQPPAAERVAEAAPLPAPRGEREVLARW